MLKIDPAQIYDYEDGSRGLFLNVALTDAVVDFLAQEKINLLVVEQHVPARPVDKKRLNQILSELWLNDPATPAEMVHGLRNLKSLTLAIPADQVPFADLPLLEKCALSGQRRFPEGLGACPRLASLSLTDCQFKTLEPLAGLARLTRLELVSVKAPSLAPIGGLSGLRHLTVSRCNERDLHFLAGCTSLETCFILAAPKLETLEGLEKLARLAELRLAGAGKLEDLGPLRGLAHLQQLILESCPNVASLRPLTKLNRLETLLLWETTSVKDGDVRCLSVLPKLRKFVFKDRKHYNVSARERLG